LYPLTENTPKALLPVGGKPMLDWIVEKINDVEEVDEIVVITNDRFAPQFVNWAKRFMTSKDIHVINDGTKTNEDRLGTIGDIALALKLKGIDDDLLIIGGDNLFDFSLPEFVAFAREHTSSALAVFDLKNLTNAKNFGIATLDEAGKVSSFVEKPTQPASSLVATLCYFLKKEDAAQISKYIAEGNKPDRAGDFIAWLIGKQTVFGYTFAGNWFDIGTPDQYQHVCALYDKVKRT